MLGGFGQALIFICLLIAETILGACVLAYAAHCFLVVVEVTAAGNDEVTWPDEPMVDWLVQAVHLLWLVAFWLVPLGIAQRPLKTVFLPDAPLLLRLLVLAAPLLWLFFPISLLSSLSARARWVFFNPRLLPRLGRCFGSLLVVYFFSALLLAGWGALWYFTLSGIGVLLLAAPASAAILLIYARLLGWLAWRVSQVQVVKSKRTAASNPRQAPRQRSEVVDPWAVPRGKSKRKEEESEPPSKPLPVEGYGLAEPQPAPPSSSRKKKGKVEKGNTPTAPVVPEPPSLLPREQGPPPTLGGSFLFPWTASGLKAWFWLTGGALVLGGMMALQAQMFPA
jgi:hypothetical protein